MTQLPAEGRQGPAPKWPLADDVKLRAQQTAAKDRVKQLLREIDVCEDGRKLGRLNKELGRLQELVALLTEQIRAQRRMELAVWTELWATPQAVAWERLRWTREVATYVRYKVLGELGDLEAAKESRLWSDRLGLSPLALLRLRWEIVRDEVAEQRGVKAAAVAAAPAASRRRLMMAVDPAAS